MAELKNGLHSGTSGRVGNLITYERNGKFFVRSRPNTVKQPNTEKQLLARSRFALLQPVNALLKEVLRFGFATDNAARPAYSAALSWNLKHAIKGSYPALELDFEQLRVFQGARPLPTHISLHCENNTLALQWEHTAADSLYAQDRAVLVLLSLDDQFVDFRLEAAKRSDQQLDYRAPLPPAGVHVYLSFYSQIPVKGSVTEADVCPSFYCGHCLPDV